MSLHAADGDFATQAPASSNSQGIAEFFRATRLPNEAMAWRMAIFFHPFQHLTRTVYGWTFFVSGNEKTDGAVEHVFGFAEIVESGRHETGDVAFHVGRAASKKPAIVNNCAKGGMCPICFVTGRNHVGMPCEANVRCFCANAGEKVVDVRRVFI